MARSLSEIRHDIMIERLTDEDWLRLEKEVDDAMKSASEEEIEEFVDSGAGEALDMACSAIREIKKYDQCAK